MYKIDKSTIAFIYNIYTLKYIYLYSFMRAAANHTYSPVVFYNNMKNNCTN